MEPAVRATENHRAIEFEDVELSARITRTQGATEEPMSRGSRVALTPECGQEVGRKRPGRRAAGPKSAPQLRKYSGSYGGGGGI